MLNIFWKSRLPVFEKLFLEAIKNLKNLIKLDPTLTKVCLDPYLQLTHLLKVFYGFPKKEKLWFFFIGWIISIITYFHGKKKPLFHPMYFFMHFRFTFIQKFDIHNSGSFKMFREAFILKKCNICYTLVWPPPLFSGKCTEKPEKEKCN